MVWTTKEAIMSALAQQVSKFVAASEALHWRLIEGDSLTAEDRNAIERTAVQLLMRIEASRRAPARPQKPSSNKVWKRWDEYLDEEPQS